MNDRSHEPMLDDVAVYALGTLPPAEAQRVREHIAICAICQEEYAQLAPTVSAIGLAAETVGDARECPSSLLKPRIMQRVRADVARPIERHRRSAPVSRGPVWPAYLVAAACLAFALISSIANIAISGHLKQTQTQVAQLSKRSTALARNLANEHTTLSDLMNANATRYPVNGGEIVTRGSHVYIAMHDVPEPPRGKVYQAWTLPKGSKKMAPSVTFVPDSRGVAVVALPVDARAISVVAVSVEPRGGSKQPTTKPLIVVPLD